MAPKKLWTLVAFLLLALVGCAAPGSTPVSAPPQTPTYYYVGAREVTLKATPDSTGANGAVIRLNERVQSLERRGAGSWCAPPAARKAGSTTGICTCSR